jgi:ABC transporter, ATP-binding protein (fragment)
MLALSGMLYTSGDISAEYMVGMVLFLFDIFISIKSYYGQMARLTVTNASLDRIEEVFAAEELDDRGQIALKKNAKDDGEEVEIKYKNVNFRYTEKDVLKNVSFKVKKGEMTALVGSSGGGKSTIASLLARFWDIKDGTINVKGEDIRKVSLGSLMDQISMVFQRVYLFQSTVYNNIAIGRPEATKEEVIEAAKKARCYDFMVSLQAS